MPMKRPRTKAFHIKRDHLDEVILKRIDRFRETLETYVEIKMLARQRYQLYKEANISRFIILAKLEKEMTYFLRHTTAYTISRLTNFKYQNIIYPMRKKLLKIGAISKEQLKVREYEKQV